MSDIPSMLLLLAAMTAVLALGCLAVTVSGLRHRRLRRMLLGGAALVPSLLLLLVAGLLVVNAWTYRALIHEELVVVVETRPLAERRFEALFRYPDGREQRLLLAGDELYVDARILKWKYWANLLGLHTGYALDRVAGRYRSLEDERAGQRTVHSLAEGGPADLFSLRRRFPQLAPLVDAEFGSATFVPADRPAGYEIRVSTTGLLARRVATP